MKKVYTQNNTKENRYNILKKKDIKLRRKPENEAEMY